MGLGESLTQLQVISSNLKTKQLGSTLSTFHLTSENVKTEKRKDLMPDGSIDTLQEWLERMRKMASNEEQKRMVGDYHQEYLELDRKVKQLKMKKKERESSNYLQQRLETQQEEQEQEWEESCNQKKRQINLLKQRIQQQQEKLQPSNKEQVSSTPSVAQLQTLLADYKDEKQNWSHRLDQSRTNLPVDESQVADEITHLKSDIQRYQTLIRDTKSRVDAAKAQLREQNPTSSAEISTLPSRRQLLQTKKSQLAQIKQQMLTLVTHNYKSGNPLALPLAILAEQGGQMPLTKLKADLEHSVPANDISRLIYGLMAKGLVAIDRSATEGIVTLLIL